MALNLDAMKAKLDKLNGKGDGKKNFWRPEDGESNIRIVSTKDGDPFKEKYFHYGVGNQSFLCPKRNFGDDCPACNFGNKLWNEGTEDSKKHAKEMFAKQLYDFDGRHKKFHGELVNRVNHNNEAIVTMAGQLNHRIDVLQSQYAAAMSVALRLICA